MHVTVTVTVAAAESGTAQATRRVRHRSDSEDPERGLALEPHHTLDAVPVDSDTLGLRHGVLEFECDAESDDRDRRDGIRTRASWRIVPRRSDFERGTRTR